MYRGIPRSIQPSDPLAEAHGQAAVFGPRQAESSLRSQRTAKQLHLAEEALSNLVFMVSQAQDMKALREVARLLKSEYELHAERLDKDFEQQQNLLSKMTLQAVLNGTSI